MRKSPTVYLIICECCDFSPDTWEEIYLQEHWQTPTLQHIGNLELYRLVTCMFFHFGIMHLLCNMFSLFQLGIVIEQMYSKKTLVFVYFTTGILSSLGSCVLHAFLGQSVLSAGASGAICGLIGFLIGNMRSRIRNSFWKYSNGIVANYCHWFFPWRR